MDSQWGKISQLEAHTLLYGWDLCQSTFCYGDEDRLIYISWAFLFAYYITYSLAKYARIFFITEKVTYLFNIKIYVKILPVITFLLSLYSPNKAGQLSVPVPHNNSIQKRSKTGIQEKWQKKHFIFWSPRTSKGAGHAQHIGNKIFKICFKPLSSQNFTHHIMAVI